jgi:hypothetical protein
MSSMHSNDSDMAFDLQQSIETLITPQWIEETATRSGEDVRSLALGFQIANAAAVYHIYLRSQQPQKQLGIQRMAKVAAGSSLQRELTYLFQGKAHLQGILNMTRILLGDEYRAVEKKIQEHTQLKEATIQSLLQTSIPAMLSVCGSKIASRKLNPEGFALFMAKLKPGLLQLVPQGVLLPYQQWEKMAYASMSSKSFNKSSKKKSAAASIFGRLKWSFFLLAGLAIIWMVFLK